MSIRPLLLCACLITTTTAGAATPAAKAKPPTAAKPVAACVDFYEHANGEWLKANPVPEGYASWGTFDELSQRNLAQQKQILEDAASAPKDDLDRLMGDLYASGMDEAAIEAAGATPLAPLFARIDKFKKPKELAPLLADLHARGLPVVFDFGANDDILQPTHRIAYATQGGLGLPDRDYYLRDDADTKNLMTAYRAYVERLLTLSGSTNATRDAGWVLEIETRLANASLALLQLRDPNNSYRPTPVKELHERYPTLEWKKFLKAQNLSKVDSISLAHTNFFTEVENIAKTVQPEPWRAYLRFHVAHALAPYLSRGFQDAHEALYLRTLRGSKEPLPRWRRVLTTVESLLSHAIGQRYAERHLPATTKAQAEALVQSVRAALRARIEQSNWLGTEAELKALAKLDALDLKLGYPAHWPTYPGLEFQRNAYANNVLTAAKYRHARLMTAVGQPREEWQWPQPAQALNAYYDPARNQLVVPAGFLQPPLFDASADAATNYGALGALVAHELMHGFDALGSTFDAEGKVNAWWTAGDANAFALRTRPLEMQYDAYAALGAIKVSGRLTLAENVADLAGLETAWSAFEATQPGTAPVQGLTPAQRFFRSWATVWRRNYRDEELTLLVQTDVHAPAKFRVNGPLAHLDAFAQAYQCKPGAGFLRKKEDRVVIWGEGLGARSAPSGSP